MNLFRVARVTVVGLASASVVVWGLAACARAQPAAPLPPQATFDTRPISPQEAGQVVIDATNTAAVVATQIAGSTVTASVRNDAINATVTAISIANLYANATNESSQRTATASALQTGATEQASLKATSEQRSLYTAATEQANAQAEAALSRTEAQANGETARFVVSAIAVGAMVALVLLVAAWVVIKRMQTEVKVMALKIEAISRAMKETSAGTAVIGPDGQPVFFPRAGPVPLLEAAELDSRPSDSDAPPIPKIVINDRDGAREVPALSQDEIAAQAEMIRLLDASVEFYRAQGQAGMSQKQIVSSKNLKWAGSTWQTARNYFGPALDSSAAGTFSADGLTLGELRTAVRLGNVKIVLSVPGNASNERERPEYERSEVLQPN